MCNADIIIRIPVYINIGWSVMLPMFMKFLSFFIFVRRNILTEIFGRKLLIGLKIQ